MQFQKHCCSATDKYCTGTGSALPELSVSWHSVAAYLMKYHQLFRTLAVSLRHEMMSCMPCPQTHAWFWNMLYALHITKPKQVFILCREKRIMVRLPYLFISPFLTYMGCSYRLPLIWNSQFCTAICKHFSRPDAAMINTKKGIWKCSFQCHSAQMYHERPMCGKTAWPQSSHVHGLIGISFNWHFSSHIIFFCWSSLKLL